MPQPSQVTPQNPRDLPYTHATTSLDDDDSSDDDSSGDDSSGDGDTPGGIVLKKGCLFQFTSLKCDSIYHSTS